MASEKRLIYLDDVLQKLLIDAAENKGIIRSLILDVVDYLKKEPVIDAVEVVRCKDCWKSGEGMCSYNFKNVPGKDFCGDGERKDNG